MTEKAASVLNKLPKVIGLGKELVPGAVAGAGATAIVMPLDTIADVQKQWRNDPKASPEVKRISKSYLRTAKKIYKDEGVRGFYAGLPGKVTKVAPSMAITMAITNALQNKLKVK